MRYYSHDAFLVLDGAWRMLNGQRPHLDFNSRPMWEVSAYTAIAAIIGTALYFFRIRHLPLTNQLICLCVASILLPPMSNDYTLLYLYVPWAFLILSTIQDERAGVKRSGVLAAFVCFGMLLSPESEVIIYRAAIGGQIKAVTLLVLLYIALKHPFALPCDETGQSRKHVYEELFVA